MASPIGPASPSGSVAEYGAGYVGLTREVLRNGGWFRGGGSAWTANPFNGEGID